MNASRLRLLILFLGWHHFAYAGPIWELFPTEHLYPRYEADPQRPVFNVQAQNYQQTSIGDVAQQRVDLKVGGALLLAQWNEELVSSSPWLQLILEAGMHAQFDAAQSLDNIGWDGLYGLYFALRQNSVVTWRVGMGHVSAHVGDEWLLRTGRVRIDYTRQERRLGVSWAMSENTVTYLDAGYGYLLGNDSVEKPWRVQTGIQWSAPNTLLDKRIGWYAATDLSAFQENDWRANVTMQIGFLAAHQERRWRLGLEFYRGRAQLGEFFQEHEQYLSLGLWADI